MTAETTDGPPTLGQIAYEAFQNTRHPVNRTAWTHPAVADVRPAWETTGAAAGAAAIARLNTPRELAAAMTENVRLRKELHEAEPAEPSALGLKHAVTSNRLGHALAALREIAEPGSDEFPRDTARNALDDDAAIRDGVALTREPQAAPELAAAVYRLACGCPISNGKNPLGNWTCVVHGPTTMIGESAAQPAPELTPGQAGDGAFWAWMDAYVDEPHNASYEVPDMQRAYEAGHAAVEPALHERDAQLADALTPTAADFDHAAEIMRLRGVLERLADEDTPVLDEGLGGGHDEENHVRAQLARQVLGLSLCGCSECRVSLGIDLEDE